MMNDLLLIICHKIVSCIVLASAELRIFKLIKSYRTVEFVLLITNGSQRVCILLTRHCATLEWLLTSYALLDVELRSVMLILLVVLEASHLSRPLIHGIACTVYRNSALVIEFITNRIQLLQMRLVLRNGGGSSEPAWAHIRGCSV